MKQKPKCNSIYKLPKSFFNGRYTTEHLIYFAFQLRKAANVASICLHQDLFPLAVSSAES